MPEPIPLIAVTSIFALGFVVLWSWIFNGPGSWHTRFHLLNFSLCAGVTIWRAWAGT